MRRNGGVAAGIIAALAFVGVSNYSKSPATSGGADQGKTAVSSRHGETPRSNKPHAPCMEIAKRLRRVVTHSEKPVESWDLPQSCYEGERQTDLEKVRALPDVHFVVATVSNPVSTHLPLSFDRQVEAIQQAAQDDDYVYDSSWFPWETTEKSYELLRDQRKAEDLQEIQLAQPGVMVFRRSLRVDYNDPFESGLVVLLVGEQPTGGISDDQFENALAWIRQLAGPSDDRLKVLGPTFSGSFPSLRRALERKRSGYSRFSILSGSVSSALGSQWFKGWIAKLHNQSEFETAMERDSLTTDRFCNYLNGQRYDVKRVVAFLSEDETAFGGIGADPKSKSTCDGTMRLYYPRDIATLRSAYEEQSILNPAKTESNGSARSTSLRGDLSEPATNDHDTVRNYGGQLTPLAQEAILMDIANRLNEKRIEFVILRSTNSLDQIFLSQFLRRAYPEARVVIDGADLLFSRGAQGKSLRGVMLLSTYPLIVAAQDWIPSLNDQSAYRSFGVDAAEGLYLAAREMFDPEGHSGVAIRDYGAPAWAVSEKVDPLEKYGPATWLSVIGRREIWPLAALNASTLGDPSGTPPSSGGSGDSSPIRLPTTTWMFLLACFLGGLVHLYFCHAGSIRGSPRARAYFAPLPRREHPALIALGSTILAMLAIVAVADSGLFSYIARAHPFHEAWTGPVLLVFVVLSILVAFGACLLNYRLAPVTTSKADQSNGRWQMISVGAAMVCTGGFIGVEVYLVGHLTLANRIPSYWRSVHLTSGVSGMLPQVLLLAGAYLWFWFNLRGLAHFGEDRPRLPEQASLPAMMPMFCEEQAGAPIENASVPLRRLKLLIGIFGLTGLVCWLALEGNGVRTLGEPRYGVVIFGWVCFYIAIVVTDGIRMWEAWNELHQLLIYLDRLPARRTLRALKGLAWGSIWKMSGNVLQERYRVISLQIESLGHLKNTLVAMPPDSWGDRRLVELLAKINKTLEKRADFAKWYVELPRDKPVNNLTVLHDFQVDLAFVAGMTVTNFLRPEWQSEKPSLLFGRPDDKAVDEGKKALNVPTDELKPLVRCAEEFFVLPYLAFIQNILGRIRTIALGSLWLFVGATLAVSSYPFEPLSALAGIFLVVFVAVGGVTILVYSQMSRDATLSHITDTEPGQLGLDFWVRLVGFGIGPLIGLLTTLFPSITDFVFSWLEPSVQALK